LRIHESTVTRHFKDWSYKKKVTVQKAGSSSLLSESQTQELIAHLSSNLYHHTYCITSYIKERWGLTYSVSGLNKWLKRHDFVYKKPKGRRP
jgi:transposase